MHREDYVGLVAVALAILGDIYSAVAFDPPGRWWAIALASCIAVIGAGVIIVPRVRRSLLLRDFLNLPLRGALGISRESGRIRYRGLHNVLLRVETIQTILDAVVETTNDDAEARQRLYSCGYQIGQGFAIQFYQVEMFRRGLTGLSSEVLDLWKQYDHDAGFATLDFTHLDLKLETGQIVASDSFLAWGRKDGDKNLCFLFEGYISACLTTWAQAVWKASSRCQNELQRFHRACHFDITRGQLVSADIALSQGPSLVVIMFTDIENSTGLTAKLRDLGAQELIRAHNRIVRDVLKRYSGSEIKGIGDGILATFGSASQGLAAAIEIQQTVTTYIAEHAELSFRVRIGLNAGEPVKEEGDIYGTAVQLAARICKHAKPGTILTSNVLQELARGKDFEFSEPENVQLLGAPEQIYEVKWELGAGS